MTAKEIAETLTKSEADSLRHIASCGEAGWWIHGIGANWVSVALLEKRYPNRLFIGGKLPVDDRWLRLSGTNDTPEAYSPVHVRLTDFGKQVLDALEHADAA